MLFIIVYYFALYVCSEIVSFHNTINLKNKQWHIGLLFCKYFPVHVFIIKIKLKRYSLTCLYFPQSC